MKPHKHAALIKAWADGAIIQRCGSDNVWRTCNNPMMWYEDGEYRVKPAPSDVDKYGVEVGDIWRTESGDILTLHKIGKCGWSISLPSTHIHKCGLVSLLFRRGEVNEL